MVRGPVAGLHYPAATGEFLAWFSTDADCLNYLEWLRWPSGFIYPQCGQGGWRLGDGRFECSACGRRTSVTAGGSRSTIASTTSLQLAQGRRYPLRLQDRRNW